MIFAQRVFVIFFGICLLASNSHAKSLRDAIKRAIETNPKIEAALASRRATDYVLKQAQGRFLPEIDLNADIGKEKIDRPQGFGPLVNNRWRRRKQATISVRQVLFDGWDRANDIYRSQARITAASYKVLARSELLGLSVVEAYIDVIRHRDLLRLAARNIDRHQHLLSLIRDRFEGGKAPIGDVEQTIERIEAAKSLVAQIRIAYETAVAKYRNSVGEKPGKLNPVRAPQGLPVSRENAVAAALSNNPQIQAAAAEIDIANFNKKQFRSSLFPKLSLEGNATIGENLGGTPGSNEELRGMVVLTWKLYDGGIRRNREFELSERHAQKIAEQEILARQISLEIETSWARYVHGRTQVNSLRKQVEQNKRVLRAYQDEFDANNRSLLDLLDAESGKFASEFSLSNTRALYLFSGYQILAQTGTLLNRMGIEAPDGNMVIKAPSNINPLYNSRFDKFAIPPLR